MKEDEQRSLVIAAVLGYDVCNNDRSGCDKCYVK